MEAISPRPNPSYRRVPGIWGPGCTCGLIPDAHAAYPHYGGENRRADISVYSTVKGASSAKAFKSYCVLDAWGRVVRV